MILVRHAMPELDPAVPHHDWRLGADGRAAARALAPRLTGARVVTSPEPKALETAEEIVDVRGGALTVDDRLREVVRPSEWDEGYRTVARRYVGGEPLAGWEPHSAVIARVREGVAGADIVVTHGLAMTLYLGAGAGFWEELRFPDAWSALAGHLRRVD